MSAPDTISAWPSEFKPQGVSLSGGPIDMCVSYTRTDLIPSDPRVTALVEAATAVVNRWHQPTWKDAGPTGQFIGELEAALAALKGVANE